MLAQYGNRTIDPYFEDYPRPKQKRALWDSSINAPAKWRNVRILLNGAHIQWQYSNVSLLLVLARFCRRKSNDPYRALVWHARRFHHPRLPHLIKLFYVVWMHTV